MCRLLCHTTIHYFRWNAVQCSTASSEQEKLKTKMIRTPLKITPIGQLLRFGALDLRRRTGGSSQERRDTHWIYNLLHHTYTHTWCMHYAPATKLVTTTTGYTIAPNFHHMHAHATCLGHNNDDLYIIDVDVSRVCPLLLVTTDRNDDHFLVMYLKSKGLRYQQQRTPALCNSTSINSTYHYLCSITVRCDPPPACWKGLSR